MRSVVAAALLAAALGATALPAAQPSSPPRPGGTFRAVFSADPPTLDPAHATDLTSAVVVRQIFDGLLELDAQLRPVPALASGWTISDDRRTYTFPLRRGVRFHNGRELRAADVKYSFERAARGKRPWVFDKLVGAREFLRGASAA